MRVVRSALILFLLAAFTSTALAASSQSFALSWNGQQRNYLLYRPFELGRQQAAPLVIVLHGGYGSGAQAEKAYKWDEMADSKGFIVAYPDGIGRSWNAGGECCGPAMHQNIDDVGFLTALIQQISQNENIDPKRIYMTGMSNGAVMSYRYACEGSFPLAAIGTVAGSLMVSCATAHPTSLMEIHGLADQHIPMQGGQGSQGHVSVNWAPVKNGFDQFTRIDQCTQPAVKQSGMLTQMESQCAAGRAVDLITIDGAGHQWPGAQARSRVVNEMLGADEPSMALDATATLWAFFQPHAMP